MERKEDINWTQRKRLANLQKTREYVNTWGGWFTVLADRDGFENWLASMLGCTKMKATEYIDILRGTVIFEAKMKDLNENPSKLETEKQ